jgi:hypothetical protein
VLGPPECAQDIFNPALGQEGIVEVTNMAIPGATSDVSSFVLEHEQWPPQYPDIIIRDHGTNDGMASSDDRILLDNLLQTFYQSTRRLRKCRGGHQNNRKLPLVWYSWMIFRACTFDMFLALRQIT